MSLTAIAATGASDAVGYQPSKGSTPGYTVPVAKATHLTLSVSPSPAKYGQRVTIRAGGLPGAATGTVSFDLGTTQPVCQLAIHWENAYA